MGEYYTKAAISSVSAAKNQEFQDMFEKPLNERDAFALNPFGFNLEKLRDFFKSKRNEVNDDYQKRYLEYRETGDPYDSAFPDGIDEIGGMMSFGQWLENILVPYSRRWFEDRICNLISQLDWASEEPKGENGNSAFTQTMSDFRRKKLMESAFLLGRMVEHYRWKFQHETTIIQRNHQFERAGKGGGNSSKSKKTELLLSFMDEIERLADLYPRIGEQAILNQAFQNAVQSDEKLWRQGKGRQPEYEIELRSILGLKDRYYAVFKRTA